jgi:lipid-binding SYLF domain-containing protein
MGKELKTMMHNLKKLPLVVGLAALAAVGSALAAEPTPQELNQQAQQALATFKKSDPSMDKLFSSAAGYVVIPSVKKGAFVVGGAGGTGVLYEKGVATGRVTLTQMSVGLQAGGQVYSEIVFLADKAALERFKTNKLEISAQMSAVAAKSGASANAKYNNGVVIMTTGEGGLMYEASVGGQKFKYEPYGQKAPGT